MKNLYLKLPKKPKSLKELFDLGFTNYNGYFTHTYYDSTYEEKQCKEARRSLDDLLLIASTYLDNITDADILKYLTTNEKYFLLIWCYGIEKPVFKSIDKAEAEYYMRDNNYMQYSHLFIFNDDVDDDEFFTRRGDSMYNIEEIIKLIK